MTGQFILLQIRNQRRGSGSGSNSGSEEVYVHRMTDCVHVCVTV